MFRFIFTVFLIQFINFSAFECLAKNIKETTGVEKKLTVGEKVYNYKEKVYVDNNLIEIPIEKGILNIKSPENTLINILSSIYIGDYDWRKQLIYDVENIENTEKFLRYKSQAKTFLKNKLYLDKKFEFKQSNSYVVIELAVVVNGGIINIPYTFYRNADGDWKLCLQCSTDKNHDLYLFLLNDNFNFVENEKIINKKM